MATVTYAYVPNQSVYVINECSDKTPFVTSGLVIRVRVEITVTETVIKYDIRLFGDGGTTEFVEADVFFDKALAVAEYETRIQ
jgi:hypothetical protein